MNSNFEYKGIVNLQFKKNNKVLRRVSIHNHGENALFLLFAKLLTATNIQEDELPYYLDVKGKIGETYVSCLQFPIIANKSYKIVGDSKNYATVIDGTIYYSNLNQNVEATTNKRVELLSKNGSLLAYVDNDTIEEETKKITPGMQAIIEWTL